MFLANSKEDFTNSMIERFSSLIDRFSIDSAIAQYCNVDEKMFSDNDIVPLFGSIEQFEDARKFMQLRYKEKQISKLEDRISTIASVRLLGDVELYPDYDTDDAHEIAESIFYRVTGWNK